MDELLQKQIHDNAEEMHNFVNSIKDWEKDMKSKDEELTKIVAKDDDKAKQKEEIIKKREEADLHKQKGNEFVKLGKWNEAIKEYTASIKLCDDDAVYYGNRSYCYQQLEKYEEAESDCNRALELKPIYVKVALRRANIRKHLGNIEGAAKDYNTVLYLDPKNTIALKEYEEIYSNLIEYYSKFDLKLPDFLEINPSSRVQQQQDEENKNETNQAPKKTTPIKRQNVKKVDDKKQINKIKSTEKRKDIKVIDYEIITPQMFKAPHLRSKLPLRKIKHIEDVYQNPDEADDMFI